MNVSMTELLPVAGVTLLTGLMYFVMALRVAAAHTRSGIVAPQMTGDPILERTVRAHVNTLEWMPIFLPALWLFAIYWRVDVAAGLGLLWIVGRIVYFVGYVRSPSGRRPGFLIQVLAASVLLFGALGRVAYLMALG